MSKVETTQGDSKDRWTLLTERAVEAEARVKELEDGIRTHRANMLDCCDVEEYYDTELYELLEKQEVTD